MDKIGVALVGCGEIATFHAQALERSGKARLVATLDKDMAKAQAMASQYGAKVYGSLDALLGDPEVEVVYVLTRHDSHAEICLQTLTAGKHVFCEKPLAMTLQQAREVQQAVRACNRFLMVGFNHRWNPAIRWAQQWIQQRQSPIRSLHLTFATSHFLESWAGLEKEGGGVLVCLGSHVFDLACVLLGEVPARVAGMTARLRLPRPYLEDTATVLMQTTSGALASLDFHDHAAVTYPNYGTGEPSRLVRAEIFGEGWSILIEHSHLLHLFEQEVHAIALDGDDPLEILGILPEDNYFLDCILNGTQPTPNVDDGVRAAYLVALAALAAQTGCAKTVQPDIFSQPF